MNKIFDLVIIGSGPGGYVAAIRAAQLGKKVAVVEKQHLGGICLNWGCIPTKALLRSAEIFHFCQNLEKFGLNKSDVTYDIKNIVSRSRNVASQLSKGVKALLKKNKVEVLEGFGSFITSNKIKIENSGKFEEIEGRKIIIATGARARIIDGFEPDGKLILTYKEAMIPDSMPKKIAIVGSGAIGVEFASFYSTMGVEVHLLEAQDRILPVEDFEISNLAQKLFTSQNINIHTSIKLNSANKKSNSIELNYIQSGNTKKIEVDRLIMAVGIVPNIENLSLEKTKVSLEKNFHIKTDEYLKTDDDNIYAIGDVVSGPWLAHKASHEGILVVEKIFGLKVKPIRKKLIPGCTYSMPQIASVGITEQEIKEKNIKVKIGRFPFIGNGKAIALGEQEGMIKIIFDEKTGEILGAHMIGAEVTELINSFVLAMNLEATEEDIFHTIFPHPTLSEMIHESALNAYGKSIHI